ncbi:GTPase-activating protein S13 [Rhizopus azygosporus]|uniref:GTPase-activating protein S13 n=1 Tax=Rhizopus azygosporus TaxID=86630 RepID=A0A367J7U4_RHIAZ|nr:GTPase-activating protein S13 [Rhizopus azygosporus]
MYNTARTAVNIRCMNSETRETAEEINELALEDMVQVYIDEKICYIIVFHDGKIDSSLRVHTMSETALIQNTAENYHSEAVADSSDVLQSEVPSEAGDRTDEVLTSITNATQTIETNHEDMIHDAQLDYYSRRLATASSDHTIKIFNVDGDNHTLTHTITDNTAPVWQVTWAHPKFGTILASCAYDGRVLIFKEQNGTWTKIHENNKHTASVNSVAWAPHELGAILACASSDGKVSIHEYKDNGSWETQMIDAHGIGCNAVTWAPAAIPGSLVQASGGNPNVNVVKKIVSAGCDNLIKIWGYKEETKTWYEEETLDGHSDWVRDVAWAPNVGLPKSYLASCSQDKSVLIWTQEHPKAEWTHKTLGEKFPDVVWRVSWSLSGNVLAVSCGDNKVTLWKESPKGDWELLQTVEENA